MQAVGRSHLQITVKLFKETFDDLGLLNVPMEDFGARDEISKKECLRLIKQESDVFVGFYAHRYGYIHDNDSMSITEAEYEAATLANLKRFTLRCKQFIKPVFWEEPLAEPPEELEKIHFSLIKPITKTIK